MESCLWKNRFQDSNIETDTYSSHASKPSIKSVSDNKDNSANNISVLRQKLYYVHSL